MDEPALILADATIEAIADDIALPGPERDTAIRALWYLLKSSFGEERLVPFERFEASLLEAVTFSIVPPPDADVTEAAGVVGLAASARVAQAIIGAVRTLDA